MLSVQGFACWITDLQPGCVDALVMSVRGFVQMLLHFLHKASCVCCEGLVLFKAVGEVSNKF